jgi:DNA-binding GntR family transcriptional regulator
MRKVRKAIALPEFSGPRSLTSQEYAYQRLRQALMFGAVAPGRAITIRDLAEALAVSATPVREALRRLSSEHALLVLRNRRIRVPDISAARVEELVSLRCALEVYAAKRALPYVNNVLIDALARIDERLDEAIANDRWESMVMLNQRFHAGIYTANPNQVLMPMIESLWLQLGPFMGLAARYQKDLYRVDRHQETLEALRRRDSLTLGMAIEADIRDAVNNLDPETLRKMLEEDDEADVSGSSGAGGL